MTAHLPSKRSEGIDLVRCWFSLHVLFLAHTISWATQTQGASSVPAFLSDLVLSTVWLFQGHGELNPAVIGFIVLSGYCIHRNGLRPGRSIQAFAIRRFFRIFPVFLLGTIVGIALFMLSSGIDSTKAMALTGTQNIDGACIAAKLSAVASLWPIAHRCDFQGNAPLLTVMVEIALYAAYGLLFLTKKPWLVPVIAVGSVLAGLVIAFQNHSHPLVYNWWQNGSLWAFFPLWWIGAAVVSDSWRIRLFRWLPAIAVLWIAATYVSHIETTAVVAELRKLLLSLLFAALVAWVDRLDIRPNIGSWLGRASYSIYGMHAPIVIFLLLAGVPWWAAAAAAIAIGVISFSIFERPIDRIGHRLSKRLSSRPIIEGQEAKIPAHRTA